MEGYRHKFLIVKEEGSGAPKGTILRTFLAEFVAALPQIDFPGVNLPSIATLW